MILPMVFCVYSPSSSFAPSSRGRLFPCARCNFAKASQHKCLRSRKPGAFSPQCRHTPFSIGQAACKSVNRSGPSKRYGSNRYSFHTNPSKGGNCRKAGHRPKNQAHQPIKGRKLLNIQVSRISAMSQDICRAKPSYVFTTSKCALSRRQNATMFTRTVSPCTSPKQIPTPRS